MSERSELGRHELLALAAVGALDDDERAEVEELIADRPDLRAELDGLRGAASTMAAAVSAAPPAALRGRVLDLIASTPQHEADRTPERPASSPPALAPVVPIAAGRRRRIVTFVGAVAAAVVLVAAALVVIGPFGANDAPAVADVLADERATTVELRGEIGLQLVHSLQLGAGVLTGHDVPVPAGDQVYELWLLESETFERVDIFRPDDDGRVVVLIDGMEFPPDVRFAVTVEPAGGVDQPTGEMVAVTA
ncbi:MAG: anti-sigma factor [Acidimicrobiia bacterium]|nr:anti-sigma factor [Acidimicrobiia bacterium]